LEKGGESPIFHVIKFYTWRDIRADSLILSRLFLFMLCNILSSRRLHGVYAGSTPHEHGTFSEFPTAHPLSRLSSPAQPFQASLVTPDEGELLADSSHTFS
jgi:hypothetical protein